MGTGPTSLSSGAPRYRFGIYELNSATRELTREGVKVKLQDQPYLVLLCLLERPKDIVTREELIKRLWPPDTFVDFDHSLNVAIKKLREALRDNADNPTFIETKPKLGYRFIAPVDVVVQPRASQEPGQALVPATQPNRQATRSLFVLIQVMYLVFYSIALVRFHHLDEAIEPLLASRTWIGVSLVMFTAMLGIPVRLYLSSAVLFDYPKTGEKFLRLFPAVLLLDLVWALSPFLAARDIGFGLALVVTTGLLYLPFSQRTLIRMTYPQS